MTNYGFYTDYKPYIRLKMIQNEAWFTTSMFSLRAQRHCSSVMALNLFHLFYLQGKTTHFNASELFSLIHKKMGNGPQLWIKSKMKRIFAQKGLHLQLTRIKKRQDIFQAIQNNTPVLVLLRQHLFDWHWVMVVGVIDEDTLEIVDNWHQKGQRAYPLNQKAKLIQSFAYSCTLL